MRRLTLRRTPVFPTYLLASLSFLSLLSPFCRAQTTQAAVESFEVASIHPYRGSDPRVSVQFLPGGGLRATNVTLKLLIQVAYELRPEQISGGARWMDSDPYTVIASPPEDAPTLTQAEQHRHTVICLQTLLSERFGLSLRREQKMAPGYLLTIEKGKPKMAVSNGPGPPSITQVGRWEIHAERVPMSLLVHFLGAKLQATVIDGTGLKDVFNFQLSWPPEIAANQAEPPAEPSQESLFSSVREQLGLKLVTEKMNVDLYAILRAERPTEN